MVVQQRLEQDWLHKESGPLYLYIVTGPYCTVYLYIEYLISCTVVHELKHIPIPYLSCNAYAMHYKNLDSGLSQYFHEYIYYYTSSVITRHAVATKKYI